MDFPIYVNEKTTLIFRSPEIDKNLGFDIAIENYEEETVRVFSEINDINILSDTLEKIREAVKSNFEEAFKPSVSKEVFLQEYSKISERLRLAMIRREFDLQNKHQSQ